MVHYKEVKLSNVWRTCNKIRAAIFRVGLNLWDYYKPLDPKNNCLLSESKFVSVLAGPLKPTIGLSDQEIAELADYFRVQDGRILYTQLCEIIHDSVPDFSKNENLISGLEWEDPLHCNRLSVSEERRIKLLITKIAALVNLRRLVMRPYFQDYELIAKNVGTVTIAHFARVLTFLNIIVSADDFNLLVKKYLKDSYTLNYVAFLFDIDQVVNWMDTHGILDLGGDILPQFPGRVISAELPKLPRPEIGKIILSSVLGKESTFHPSIKKALEPEDLQNVILRVQRHVWNNRIRIEEFFKDFDPLRCGRITVSQFQRGLEDMGIGRIHRLYLSFPEIKLLIIQYRDPIDPDRVCWQTFENDINTVFTHKNLEKYPNVQVNVPPRNVMELCPKGGKSWQNVTGDKRDLCEQAVDKIRRKITRRRMAIKPAFRDYDKHNNGHVSRSQMRQCFITYGILLSDEELFALEQRFNDDVGFNYFWFLKEVEATKLDAPLYETFFNEMKKVNVPRKLEELHRRETDIVYVLAKLKGKVVRDRIRVMEFLRDYDRNNENVIKNENFVRGLGSCRLGLTPTEVETLVTVFTSPMRQEYVDYKRFCDTVEEAFTQKDLERAPLLVPLQHIAIQDCDRNFLNFDERHTVSLAIQKLAKTPEMEMNLMDLFKDFDKTNCGTISQYQLMKALTLRGLMNKITMTEFNVICKCFGFERGKKDEVDYRALCKALDLVHISGIHKPF